MNGYKTVTGYIPGLIGRITELHARYYSEHWGFGSFFEAKVGSELSHFIYSYDEIKDRIWSVLVGDTIEGLEAARHLYEKYGFHLVEERSGEQWGRRVLEQRFER
jgi:hypothetical protein